MSRSSVAPESSRGSSIRRPAEFARCRYPLADPTARPAVGVAPPDYVGGTASAARSDGAEHRDFPTRDGSEVTEMQTPQSIQVEDQEVYFTSSEDLDFLPPQSVDFFMTSPPYWNLKQYGHPDEIGQSSYEEYLERLNHVWSSCYRVAKPDAVLVVNVANRRHKKAFYPIGLDIAHAMTGWVLWDILIWYIPNALPQPNHYMERLFDSKYEFLLVFTKDGATDYEFHKPRVPQKYLKADPRAHKKNERGRCIGNIIRVPAYRPPNVKQLGYHVAAYPEELVALMLESFTSPGDRVLDPFVGSGTTLKVARGMGRSGIGIELNQDFAPLIEARIREPFELPDWKKLDILHSSTMTPGMDKPRKIHLLRGGVPEAGLFDATDDDE